VVVSTLHYGEHALLRAEGLLDPTPPLITYAASTPLVRCLLGDRTSVKFGRAVEQFIDMRMADEADRVAAEAHEKRAARRQQTANLGAGAQALPEADGVAAGAGAGRRA
jgi:hypothetical protein